MDLGALLIANAGLVLFSVVSLGLLAYFAYAMVRPERF